MTGTRRQHPAASPASAQRTAPAPKLPRKHRPQKPHRLLPRSPAIDIRLALKRDPLPQHLERPHETERNPFGIEMSYPQSWRRHAPRGPAPAPRSPRPYGHRCRNTPAASWPRPRTSTTRTPCGDSRYRGRGRGPPAARGLRPACPGAARREPSRALRTRRRGRPATPASSRPSSRSRTARSRETDPPAPRPSRPSCAKAHGCAAQRCRRRSVAAAAGRATPAQGLLP